MGSVIETARSAGRFKLLLAMVEKAKLLAELSSGGPFTLFAPDDKAMGELPKDVFGDILEDNETLTTILKYHIASGSLKSRDMGKLRSIKTIDGQTHEIEVVEDRLLIDHVLVVRPDIECSNGLIHEIESVLIPGLIRMHREAV